METNLLLLFLLIVKHCVIDLGIQSQFLWGKTYKKINYFGCHSHYLHHAVGTFIMFALLTDWKTTLLATAIDYIVHWHIDFAKHNTNIALDLKRSDKLYWWTATVDQLLHFLTYYLLVIYLV